LDVVELPSKASTDRDSLHPSSSSKRLGSSIFQATKSAQR
jgi:hypothetical protein